MFCTIVNELCDQLTNHQQSQSEINTQDDL